MPLLRPQILVSARLALRFSRNAGPSCRGGASSVLRVGQPGATFSPSARLWAQRITASTAERPEQES